MAAPVLDSPFDRLHDLPRGVWLQTLITGAGNVAARLSGAQVWLQALLQGQLPPAGADFGDAPATAGLRRAVGELALPRLCRDTPALAEQVVRTLLWHLDRINDHQPRLSRDAAVAEATREFREAWQLETQGLEESLVLLQGLGELGAQQLARPAKGDQKAAAPGLMRRLQRRDDDRLGDVLWCAVHRA